MGSQPKDSTLVEFRSEKAIVHAATYVEGELTAHVELQTVDLGGKLILECVLDIIRKVVLGQNKHILLASTEALIETLSALKAPDPMVIVQGVSAEDLEIENELARRATMREQVGLIQEELQNRRDDLREELAQQMELTRLSLGGSKTTARKRALTEEVRKVSATIDAVTRAMSDNDREVQMLILYRESRRLIERGLPPGIIGRDFSIPAT